MVEPAEEKSGDEDGDEDGDISMGDAEYGGADQDAGSRSPAVGKAAEDKAAEEEFLGEGAGQGDKDPGEDEGQDTVVVKWEVLLLEDFDAEGIDEGSVGAIEDQHGQKHQRRQQPRGVSGNSWGAQSQGAEASAVHGGTEDPSGGRNDDYKHCQTDVEDEGGVGVFFLDGQKKEQETQTQESQGGDNCGQYGAQTPRPGREEDIIRAECALVLPSRRGKDGRVVGSRDVDRFFRQLHRNTLSRGGVLHNRRLYSQLNPSCRQLPLLGGDCRLRCYNS